MAKVRFHEDESQDVGFVAPPLLADALIEQSEAVEVLSEPKVRYGQWQTEDHAVATDPWRIPKWLFIGVSASLWMMVAVTFLRPDPVWQAFAPDLAAYGLPNVSLAIVAAVVLIAFTMAVLLFQMALDGARFHQRMPSEAPEPRTTFSGRTIEDPVGLAEFDVLVKFYQDDFMYARDRGHIRLEENSIFFEGARTHFSISRTRLRWSPQDEARSSSQGALRYKVDGVQFGFTLEGDGFSMEQPDLRRRQLEYWLTQPGPPAEYEVLLPRAIPADAPREALEALRRPILLAQFVLYGAAVATYSEILLSRVATSIPAPHWHRSAGGAGAESIVLLTAVWLLAPIAWGMRDVGRYLFLRARLRKQTRS